MDAAPLELTGPQRAALAQAEQHLADGAFGTLLLHGVTGSGKTEVYLAVIARALAKNPGVIILDTGG